MADAGEEELRGWMLAAARGDAGAQHRLLSALAPRLRAFFRRQGSAPDVAEDLVQETLIAVHVKRETWDRDRGVLAWTYAIARHRQIDHWRRVGRRGVHVPVEDHLEALAAEEREDGDPTRDLARLMTDLPAKQRTAIELIKLQEKSVKEAAAITGWSESDLKVSAHRGLKALMRRAAAMMERPA